MDTVLDVLNKHAIKVNHCLVLHWATFRQELQNVKLFAKIYEKLPETKEIMFSLEMRYIFS